MFRGLINDAKSPQGRWSPNTPSGPRPAVPFVIALGFATAGITLMLVERFAHREAYVMIAAGFTTVGLLAVLVVRSKELDRKQCQRERNGGPETDERRAPKLQEAAHSFDARRNIEHSIRVAASAPAITRMRTANVTDSEPELLRMDEVQ
jgi:hypothetical protein